MIREILIDRERIAERVSKMASDIAVDFIESSGQPLTPPPLIIISIMTGSIIFLADLIRELPLMMQLELISVSSYPGKATSSQGITLKGDLPDNLKDKHILIIDDILDSGTTLNYIHQNVESQNPKWVRHCVLLRKPLPAAKATICQYVGFEIPDDFVVGYGLDYDGYYRNLPDIVSLKTEAMQ